MLLQQLVLALSRRAAKPKAPVEVSNFKSAPPPGTSHYKQGIARDPTIQAVYDAAGEGEDPLAAWFALSLADQTKLIETELAKLPDGDRLNIKRLLSFELNKPFLPNPGPQTDALLSKADLLLYGGAGGGGKRLADDTIVPVPLHVDPSGFKHHGDMVVGDQVFSPSGKPIDVIAVHPVEPLGDAYEIEFDTGEVVVADGEHLWETWTDSERMRGLRASDDWRAKRRANRPSRAVENSKKPWVSLSVSKGNREREHVIAPAKGGVRTTKDILNTLTVGRGAFNHSIDVAAAIDPSTAELPIEPYLFGCWIGDGYSSAGVIGMAQPDMQAIAHHWPTPDSVKLDIRPPRKVVFEMRRWRFLLPLLRELGVFGCKRIPPLYLRASREQRVELLRGICDTDGTCSERGQVEVVFSDRLLADDLHELVSSLGIKSTLRSKEAKDQNGNGKLHYRLKFMASFPVFHLERKVVRQKLSKFRPTVGRRYITAVRKVAPVSMRCITVGATDGLYLAGKSFIPTHNSFLTIGCAATEHSRGLILRRQSTELDGLIADSREMLTGKGDFNATVREWSLEKARSLKFGGMKDEDDWRDYAGRPRDFIGFDEAAEFLEVQVASLLGWLRSADPEQRCRAILASNPPRSDEGRWIITWFAPWLDPSFPNPAAPGELRYAVRVGDDTVWVDDVEVLESGRIKPVIINGEEYTPLSRTFIPARLDDNPYLARTNYRANLQSLPEPLRSQLLKGDFLAGRRDDDWQVIPTEWVDAAQARWQPQPPINAKMTSLGVDLAHGGADATIVAPRYGAWFAALKEVKGVDTKDGGLMAGMIFTTARDGAEIVLDAGGGYASGPHEQFKAMNVEVTLFLGAEASSEVSREGLKFRNRRAEVWWRLKEALDPSSNAYIALPPDPQLKADLTTPRWRITGGGILIESKEDIRKRLGRSPDRGDAVAMAWAHGTVRQQQREASYRRPTQANVGYATMKRRRIG